MWNLPELSPFLKAGIQGLTLTLQGPTLLLGVCAVGGSLRGGRCPKVSPRACCIGLRPHTFRPKFSCSAKTCYSFLAAATFLRCCYFSRRFTHLILYFSNRKFYHICRPRVKTRYFSPFLSSDYKQRVSNLFCLSFSSLVWGSKHQIVLVAVTNPGSSSSSPVITECHGKKSFCSFH